MLICLAIKTSCKKRFRATTIKITRIFLLLRWSFHHRRITDATLQNKSSDEKENYIFLHPIHHHAQNMTTQKSSRKKFEWHMEFVVTKHDRILMSVRVAIRQNHIYPEQNKRAWQLNKATNLKLAYQFAFAYELQKNNNILITYLFKDIYFLFRAVLSAQTTITHKTKEMIITTQSHIKKPLNLFKQENLVKEGSSWLHASKTTVYRGQHFTSNGNTDMVMN